MLCVSPRPLRGLGEVLLRETLIDAKESGFRPAGYIGQFRACVLYGMQSRIAACSCLPIDGNISWRSGMDFHYGLDMVTLDDLYKLRVYDLDGGLDQALLITFCNVAMCAEVCIYQKCPWNVNGFLGREEAAVLTVAGGPASSSNHLIDNVPADGGAVYSRLASSKNAEDYLKRPLPHSPVARGDLETALEMLRSAYPGMAYVFHNENFAGFCWASFMSGASAVVPAGDRFIVLFDERLKALFASADKKAAAAYLYILLVHSAVSLGLRIMQMPASVTMEIVAEDAAMRAFTGLGYSGMELVERWFADGMFAEYLPAHG
jgi:hypothetical protein